MRTPSDCEPCGWLGKRKQRPRSANASRQSSLSHEKDHPRCAGAPRQPATRIIASIAFNIAALRTRRITHCSPKPGAVALSDADQVSPGFSSRRNESGHLLWANLKSGLFCSDSQLVLTSTYEACCHFCAPGVSARLDLQPSRILAPWTRLISFGRQDILADEVARLMPQPCMSVEDGSGGTAGRAVAEAGQNVGADLSPPLWSLGRGRRAIGQSTPRAWQLLPPTKGACFVAATKRIQGSAPG
jgi:hypothetical protein